MAQKNQQAAGGDRRVTVDIVIVGAGPATLGLLTNACKSNRLNELVAKGDGIAVIEQGLAFGGGCLQNFGINSNTSANGFIKCLYKRRELTNQSAALAALNQNNSNNNNNKSAAVSQQSNSPNPRRFLKAGTGVPSSQAANQDNTSNASPVRVKLKDMANQGLDEGDSDDDAEDEEDVYQPKKYEYVALNPFKDLYKHSPLIQMSFEFGPSCIPLSSVGMILNYTGNHLLHYIHTVLGRRIFFPCHRVVSIQLMQNGDIITTAMRKEISIVLNDGKEQKVAIAADPVAPADVSAAAGITPVGVDTETSAPGASASALSEGDKPTFEAKEEPFKIVQHGEVQVTFRSKAVVLSNGGQQSLHPQFYTWFPFLSSRMEDVLMSDYVLQKQGYLATIQRIKTLNKKKIVIIGGSHSGFSTAWVLLNGPADILHNTHVTPTVQYVKRNTGKFEFPGAAQRTIEGCTRCCVCNYMSKKQRKGPCRCICKCYGFFKYSDWGVEESDLPAFGAADITILYRDRIRVFYSRVHQAQADNYTDYKQLSFSNKNGFLYSFTGLRGDAKRMYKRIMSGEEKRVRLVKAPTVADQTKYLEGADLVVWACGYQTNRITVKDIDNKPIQMSAKVPFSQYDVDQRCRIITSDNGLLMKTFGSGLAYPVRSNDGMILPESGKVNPRADSFSLYMNYVANTLLSNLLPKSRLQNKNHRTVRLGNKKTIAAQALQTGLAQSQGGAANGGGASRQAPGANNNWVRSGSEQTSVAQRNNTLTRPIQTKPPNAPGTSGNMQGINISKVQASPTKTPSKTFNNVKVATTSPAPARQQQLSSNRDNNSQNQTQNNKEKDIDNNSNELSEIAEAGNSGPLNNTAPRYLQLNYISEKRKQANEQQAHLSPPKKRNWVPSSHLSPPINKIPKDTAKALEQRIAAELISKEKNTLDSTIPGNYNLENANTGPLKTPTYIQMHLSESGKAFQAVSQSFSMLQPQPGSIQQPLIPPQQNRYTLKTTEFTGKFPGEQKQTGNATSQAYQPQQQQQQQPPEFVKNFSVSQSTYGMNFGATTTVVNSTALMAEKEHSAAMEKQNAMMQYSTPQKHSSNKSSSLVSGSKYMGAADGSPLVYNANMIDNTPQVHKRKASYKNVKSQSNNQQQDDLQFNGGGGITSFTTKAQAASMMTADNRYINHMKRQGGEAISSIDDTPLNGSYQQDFQALAEANSKNMQHLMASQPNQPYQQMNNEQAINSSIAQHVKPVSTSAMKRHPATAHQGPNSASHVATPISKKKSSQSSNSKHHFTAEKGGRPNNNNWNGQPTGTSLQSTNHTTVMSNQKSSPNIHKSKRAGTFLKNCQTKFQAGISVPIEMKQGGNGSGAVQQPQNSPEKNLSHLASAGQRQIFNDESDRVSSANRTNKLSDNLSAIKGTRQGFNSDMQSQVHKMGTTIEQFQQMQAVNNQSIMSIQTPKQMQPHKQVQKGQSSQSNKRRTTVLQQTKDHQRNIPLNGNFVTSEDHQSSEQVPTNLKDALENRRLIQQKQDFKDFNDRDLTQLSGMVQQQQNFGSDSYQMASADNRDSRLTQEDNFHTQDGGSANQMRQLTLPVKKTSSFAQSSTAALGFPADKSHFSPTSSKRKPLSRQKSQSRTHRSQSKGKTTQQNEKSQSNIQHADTTTIASITKDININNHVSPSTNYGLNSSGFANAANAVSQQKVVSSNSSSNVVQQSSVPQNGTNLVEASQNPHHMEGNNRDKNKQNVATVFANNGGQNHYKVGDAAAVQQSRKSMSSYDVQARLQNMIGAQSSSIVPVKVFSLPGQKQGTAGGSGNSKNNAVQMQALYMQQILMKPQNAQLSGPHIHQHAQLQAAMLQQVSMSSPQQPGSSHKKNNLSNHQQKHFITSSVQPKTVQLVPQGNYNNALKQTALNGSSPQKMQGSQTQIAQYGLMHVSASQKRSGGSTVSPHQIIVANVGPQNAYQGRSQFSNNHNQFSSSNSGVVVRKPVAAQMQMFSSSQINTTPAKGVVVGGGLKGSVAGQNFQPLKLQQHQKAQIMSYSQSQHMQHQQISISKNAGSTTVVVPPQQRQFDIHSPVTLSTKKPASIFVMEKPSQHVKQGNVCDVRKPINSSHGKASIAGASSPQKQFNPHEKVKMLSSYLGNK